MRRCAARISSFVGEVPELALERTDRLLARRVHELLVGLAGLALVGCVAEAPRLDLAVERRGEGRMLVERVLEARREADLGRLDRREAVEQLVGKGRRAVLDRAGQAVLAGDDPELAQDLEVELDLRHAAVGKWHAAVRGAGLHADLGDAAGAGREPVELAAVAVEVGAQLLHRGVLGSRASPISPPTAGPRHALRSRASG